MNQCFGLTLKNKRCNRKVDAEYCHQHLTSSNIKNSIEKIPTKNSLISKNGFRAETTICSQKDIKKSLELFFGTTIKCLKRVHKKKYDIKIIFDNETETTIQNKDGNGQGRGWSVDRRKIEAYDNEFLHVLLKTVCLKIGTVKPTISNLISKYVMNICILGTTTSEYPQYFTHTTSDKSTGKIISLNIIDSNILMSLLHSEIYNTMVPKRTCVHLSPNIYLQRKGGTKTDANPNDIQMKFRFTNIIEKQFTQIFVSK